MKQHSAERAAEPRSGSARALVIGVLGVLLLASVTVNFVLLRRARASRGGTAGGEPPAAGTPPASTRDSVATACRAKLARCQAGSWRMLGSIIQGGQRAATPRTGSSRSGTKRAPAAGSGSGARRPTRRQQISCFLARAAFRNMVQNRRRIYASKLRRELADAALQTERAEATARRLARLLGAKAQQAAALQTRLTRARTRHLPALRSAVGKTPGSARFALLLAAFAAVDSDVDRIVGEVLGAAATAKAKRAQAGQRAARALLLGAFARQKPLAPGAAMSASD